MIRLLPFVAKRAWRQPLRALLVVLGVAVAVFLFCAVEATRAGVERATTRAADDTSLIVYRENRYCPFTSQLPQRYERRIAAIPGVSRVVPVKVSVSNCRASLDVVTFRGVPPETFARAVLPPASRFDLVAGSLSDWRRRSDAALIGAGLAERRGISVGDRFSAAGITVYVAAIGASEDLQLRNAALTHLAFLQEAERRGGTGGVVTQFEVEVEDPARLDEVAAAIDAELARESDPTHTRPAKAFAKAAASDVVAAVGLARWLGLGALVAVFALVANAIVLAVQERMKEYAVLETLGYRAGHLVGLILAEGALLGLAGGALGGAAAMAALDAASLSLAMEGVQLEIRPEPRLLFQGVGAAILLSVVAGLVPALRVARRDLASAFRAL